MMSPMLVSTQGHNRTVTLSLTECAVTTPNQERVSEYCLNLRRSVQLRNKPTLTRGVES